MPIFSCIDYLCDCLCFTCPTADYEKLKDDDVNVMIWDNDTFKKAKLVCICGHFEFDDFYAACISLCRKDNLIKDLLRNRAYLLALIKCGHKILHVADPELLDDYEFMYEAVRLYPGNIKYASERLRKNKSICLMVSHHQSGKYFKYILNDDIKRDAAIFINLARNNRSYLIVYAHPDLYSDYDFMLEMVKVDSALIYYASAGIINQNMLRASFTGKQVIHPPHLIPYLVKDLINDREYVLRAVTNNVHAHKMMKCIANTNVLNHEIISAALLSSIKSLKYAPEYYKKNYTHCKNAIEYCITAKDAKLMKHVHNKEILCNKKLFKKMVEEGIFECMNYADSSLQSDAVYVKELLKINAKNVIPYVDAKLRDNEQIMNLAQKTYKLAFYFASDRLFKKMVTITHNDRA